MAQATPEVRAARRRLRALRLALGGAERRAAERAIRRALRQLRIFRRGARVALYLPIPGEVDLRPCLAAAWRAGVELYVPRIRSRRRGTMSFARLRPDAAQRRNDFGIAEPVAAARDCLGAASLDTVVLPVVGFDGRGHRLGMGAGFYDRALRRRLDAARAWRRPRLVGVAFACQQLDAIEPSAWDVPLDLVVTERGVLAPARAIREPEHRA